MGCTRKVLASLNSLVLHVLFVFAKLYNRWTLNVSQVNTDSATERRRLIQKHWTAISRQAEAAAEFTSGQDGRTSNQDGRTSGGKKVGKRKLKKQLYAATRQAEDMQKEAVQREDENNAADQVQDLGPALELLESQPESEITEGTSKTTCQQPHSAPQEIAGTSRSQNKAVGSQGQDRNDGPSAYARRIPGANLYVPATHFVSEHTDLAQLVNDHFPAEQESKGLTDKGDSISSNEQQCVKSNKDTLTLTPDETNSGSRISMTSSLAPAGSHFENGGSCPGNVNPCRDEMTGETNNTRNQESDPYTCEPGQQLMLTGLHTCGNLAPSILRIFVANPDTRVLCNVGCCYNLLDEEFTISDPG